MQIRWFCCTSLLVTVSSMSSISLMRQCSFKFKRPRMQVKNDLAWGPRTFTSLHNPGNSSHSSGLITMSRQKEFEIPPSFDLPPRLNSSSEPKFWARPSGFPYDINKWRDVLHSASTLSSAASSLSSSTSIRSGAGSLSSSSLPSAASRISAAGWVRFRTIRLNHTFKGNR